MDIKAPSYPKKESPFEGNPFARTFPDPLCKLNLNETSEFVKAFPMTTESTSLFEASAQRKRRSMEAPSTAGRQVFTFSSGNLSRKIIPCKWDDAEKWLITSSCLETPSNVMKASDPSKIHQKGDAFAEKLRVADEVTSFQGHVVLQDDVEPPCPNFRFSDPTKESSLFRSSYCESVKAATRELVSEAQHVDVGTEMTRLGSVMTLRCRTPIKSSSPSRHNTPADRSGPLVASNTTIDISELKNCHFAKLQLSAQYDSMVSNWSSEDDEEAEVSRSLRHFDMGGGRKSFADTRASLWEDEEKTKICIRYRREEEKIQAWVNLQSAKAEAQSRKQELKMQKMRSKLEEEKTKRMAIVQRRAEEWRAAAQFQHSQQILRTSEQAQKMRSQQTPQISCGCFPFNNHI